MVVVDFGWDDGKVTVGIAKVNTRVNGGWEFTDNNVTVKPTKPSRHFPSGFVVGVDGVYGWDALDFLDKMDRGLDAGPHVVNLPTVTRNALRAMRDSFVTAA